VSVPEQLQLMVPLQPSETLPQSCLPSVPVAALHALGVQHVDVDLLHSSVPVQAQFNCPPQPSGSLPHVPAG
jgi:hypothetical protein